MNRKQLMILLVSITLFTLLLVPAVSAAPSLPPAIPVDGWISTSGSASGTGEIKSILPLLQNKQCRTVYSRLWCDGYINDMHFVAFTTGVGPEAAIAAMAKLPLLYPPVGDDYELKFHGGISGVYTPLQQGDTLLPEYVCKDDWFLTIPVIVRGYLPTTEGNLGSLAAKYGPGGDSWHELWALNKDRLKLPESPSAKPGVPLLSPWLSTISDHFIPNRFSVYTRDSAYRITTHCFRMTPDVYAFASQVASDFVPPALPENLKAFLLSIGGRDTAQLVVGHAEAAGGKFEVSPDDVRRQQRLYDAWGVDMESSSVVEGDAMEFPVWNGTTLTTKVIVLRTGSDPPPMYNGGAITEDEFWADPAGATAKARGMYNTGLPLSELAIYQSQVMAAYIQKAVNAWVITHPH